MTKQHNVSRPTPTMRNDGQRQLLESMAAHGLSARDVERTTPLKRSSVGEWTRGEKVPDSSNRAELQARFGIDPRSWDHVAQTAATTVLASPVVPPSSLPELVIPHEATVDQVKREVIARLNSALRELDAWLALDPPPEDFDVHWHVDDGHPAAIAANEFDALVEGCVGREGWLVQHAPDLAADIAEAISEAAPLFYPDDASGPLEVAEKLRGGTS